MPELPDIPNDPPLDAKDSLLTEEQMRWYLTSEDRVSDEEQDVLYRMDAIIGNHPPTWLFCERMRRLMGLGSSEELEAEMLPLLQVAFPETAEELRVKNRRELEERLTRIEGGGKATEFDRAFMLALAEMVADEGMRERVHRLFMPRE